MDLVCLDLEGVLVPEIWLAVAERTGLQDLQRTTRDIPVYEELMDYRLNILARERLTLSFIQEVIAGLTPLPGAVEFLTELRKVRQVVILSDTFYEFAMPLMAQLGYPTLFCHRLEVTDDQITGYRLRQADPKRQAVRAFHSLQYHITAAGDSYNDVSMLAEANRGILFRAPQRVREEFPQFPSTESYAQLSSLILHPSRS